jgi:hypothetical protein
MFIWEKDIDAFKNGLNVISPKIFRVVISVEGGCKARLFHLKEKLGQGGAQSTKKKERREVKVRRAAKVMQVEVPALQIESRA